MTDSKEMEVTALILAGGLARRMGGVDKGLVTFGGRPLVSVVADRLRAQCATVLVSANRNETAYRSLGLEPIADRILGFCGPLAGWEAACAVVGTSYLLSAACDSPFVPLTLASRLMSALKQQPGAVAAAPIVKGKKEPVFALFSRDVKTSLEKALTLGEHRVGRWLESVGCLWVPFDEEGASFSNFNTLEELHQAEKLCGLKSVQPA